MEGDEILNYVYFDRYKPEKKIGQGSFGRIYQGKNHSTAIIFRTQYSRKWKSGNEICIKQLK